MGVGCGEKREIVRGRVTMRGGGGGGGGGGGTIPIAEVCRTRYRRRSIDRSVVYSGTEDPPPLHPLLFPIYLRSNDGGSTWKKLTVYFPAVAPPDAFAAPGTPHAARRGVDAAAAQLDATAKKFLLLLLPLDDDDDDDDGRRRRMARSSILSVMIPPEIAAADFACDDDDGGGGDDRGCCLRCCVEKPWMPTGPMMPMHATTTISSSSGGGAGERRFLGSLFIDYMMPRRWWVGGLGGRE